MLERVFSLLIIAGYVAAGGLSNAWTESSPPREYLIKAAFLYNFAKFVEWPAESFKDDLSPLNLYVLGEDPFGTALDSIKDKAIKGRKLAIKRCHKIEDVKECHILFVSVSEKGNLRHILDLLRNSNVLTVSEIEGFARLGGIINFIITKNRIHFEINHDEARHSKLKISSQLLKLAYLVTPESRKEQE